MDIIGQHFGMLVAVEEVTPVKDSRGHTLRRFLCQCDCGNMRAFNYGNLVSGRTNSCGCTRFPRTPPRDLSGQSFGKLTVISETEPHVQRNGKRMRKWMCRCECGAIKSYLQANLVSSHGPQSCGCTCNRSSIRSPRDANLLGNRYGCLTVIMEGEALARKNHALRRRMICRCDCGKEVAVFADNLLSGHTRSCGCLKSNSLKGKNVGMLTVLSRSNTGKTMPFWLCGCDCGNIVEVSFDDLFWGSVTDCGCVKKTAPDLTGTRYGRLTALRPVTPAIGPNGYKIRQWLCRCDCGRETIVREKNLIWKNTRSCGCLKREKQKSPLERLIAAKSPS